MIIDNQRIQSDPDYWQPSTQKLCFYCGLPTHHTPFIERRGRGPVYLGDVWSRIFFHEECAFRFAVLLEDDVKECREAAVDQNVDALMACPVDASGRPR